MSVLDVVFCHREQARCAAWKLPDAICSCGKGGSETTDAAYAVTWGPVTTHLRVLLAVRFGMKSISTIVTAAARC